ncbi:MAG: hypothetical protein ACFUZC_14585 [Chthoniobacteraceae bacterium]
MAVSPFHRLPLRHSQGVALVLVLCFVVLIAGMIVAFFSRTTTGRLVSNTSANGTKAEFLADTASGIIIGDIKEEILTNSTTNGSGTNAIYIPVSGSNAVPNRGSAVPDALANLIRFSSHSDASTRAANAISTGTSANRRSVSLARWNLHYLLPLANSTAGDSTPDSKFAAPDWVIFTRSGPLSGATWDKTLADPSSGNNSYAVGRYAYAIYDEGGLLDVNATGYPSTSDTTSQVGPKGGLAYADLTQLKDSSGNSLLTRTQIDQIVGWRNYATTQPSGTFPNLTFDTASASRYQALATSSSNSFLTITGTTPFNGNTDHAFMTRHQLIKLLQATTTTSAEQIQIQNALQYLGTFSREVNGPTWGPSVDYSSPYNYKSAQFGTASDVYNPCILNAKVQTAFTRGDGGQAVPGEPLVKHRFPLEKLALLEKMKGTASLTSQDTDDMARYFGLDPVSDSNGHYRHWTYPTASTKYLHGKGTSGNSGVMSLNDVANYANREPDFFELLQAGILAGSLGKGGGRGDALGNQYNGAQAFQDPDIKVTLQLLRIGANIIDQWTADNYPSTITYVAPGGSISTSDSVYGTKDLPYINKFLYSISPTTGGYNVNAGFEVWNPHQASGVGTAPTQFQISPLNWTTVRPIPTTDQYSDWYRIGAVASAATGNVYWSWNGGWTAANGLYQHFADLSNDGVISFNTSGTMSYRDTPQLSGSVVLNSASIAWPPPDTVKSGTWTWSSAVSGPGAAGYMNLQFSIVYRLQFMDEGGSYQTYGTFVGLDDSFTPPGTGYRQNPWAVPANVGWYPCPKSDPRTSRFGSGQSTDRNNSCGSSITPNSSTLYCTLKQQTPFGANASTAYRIDRWAANDPTQAGSDPKTNPTYPYYPDKDNQIRRGDAAYSYPSLSPLYDSATGGPSARPVVLCRPFRSVGELGYAFRDMPWKTLDFFSPTSADAGLLDLFSLNGTQPVLAGRLNPNTRQRPVLAAVIAGATQASGSASTVSAANASSVADAIVNYSKATPITNRADLVTGLMGNTNVVQTIGGISTIKTERESVVRALADCSNTRTWNLLIDLVAQVGKYPSTATSLDQFVVEGERHYWLHVAIDRYTGQIVDKQLELVRE